MTMANTENTKEKKTIRKRARPLRGVGGTVTEEVKTTTVRNLEPTLQRLSRVSRPVSDAHF